MDFVMFLSYIRFFKEKGPILVSFTATQASNAGLGAHGH